MLNPMALAHSRWKKRFVWHLWESRALSSARCLHALCPAEATAIKPLLPGIPIAVIPNGVALPVRASGEQADPAQALLPWQAFIPADEKVLLFLGRFHSGKGITPLLHAWEAVSSEAERQGWWLALVGYGDGGALERQLRCTPVNRCMAFGPAFGKSKQAVLASAGAFILPSQFEALPMAALEAMAHGLPCLLSSACNLPDAFEQAAALRAEPNPESLAMALQQLFGLSESARTAMGESGRTLVAQNYSWTQVAAQTHDLYTWILGGGEQPTWVA
jgi:poly(glycerol-phosphate) alpha-glucosyltransferase